MSLVTVVIGIIMLKCNITSYDLGHALYRFWGREEDKGYYINYFGRFIAVVNAYVPLIYFLRV